MSITVLSLTNYNRTNQFEFFIQNIIEQTTPIQELYLLETEHDYENIIKNQTHIKEIYNKYKNNINFNINYYIHDYDRNTQYVTPLTVEELFNIGNKNAKGDYILKMLDDTYYLPNYIEENIKNLNKSFKLIGGCAKPIIYDSILDIYIKCDEGVNMYESSMIYKKDYLNTKNNVIEELDCLFIKMIDDTNFGFYRNNIYKYFFTRGPSNDTFKIPEKYKKKPEVKLCPYDIVYLNGFYSVPWHPNDMNLGGSEQAIIKLSEEWASKNKTVAVYGNFEFDKLTHNKVDYYNVSYFPLHNKFKNLVSWRTQGLYFIINFNLFVDNLLIDLHDNMSYTLDKINIDYIYPALNKANYIMLKSNYHKECFIDYLNKYNKSIDNNKLIVINNGVRIEEFSVKPKGIERKPYRFCYCSSYDRGLAIILKYIWPHIYKKEPDAELHIYYGMDYIYDDNFKTIMTQLMGQPGVMDHGRKPLNKIIEEKYTSSYHLYICNVDAEIDCISVRESLVAKCIPILYEQGVFIERDGIKYSNELNEENCKLIADDIVFKMKNLYLINKYREELVKSETIISWDSVSDNWLKILL